MKQNELAKRLLHNQTCDNCLFRINVDAIANYPDVDKYKGCWYNSVPLKIEVEYGPRPKINTCEKWKIED